MPLLVWIWRLLTRCVTRQTSKTEDGSALPSPAESELFLPAVAESETNPSKLTRVKTLKKCVWNSLLIFLFVSAECSSYCSRNWDIACINIYGTLFLYLGSFSFPVTWFCAENIFIIYQTKSCIHINEQDVFTLTNEMLDLFIT